MQPSPPPAQDVQIARLVDRFVRRIHASLQARAPEFDPEKIGPGGSMILLTLAEIEPVSMKALAARMSRDKSQMTRSLNTLCAKRLVTREGSAADGRMSVVRLTAQGHRQVKVLQGVLAATIGDILGPMSDDDRARLIALLSNVDP